MAKSAAENAFSKLASRWQILALLATAILLLVALYSYNQYLNSAGLAYIENQASQVSIGEPTNGAQLSLLQPVTISGLAIGPNPFTSMELWINGQLMGVQAGPADGKTPLPASFVWLPDEEGSQSLVARAIDGDGGLWTSPAVLVNVVPGEGEEEETGAGGGLPADVPAVYPSAGGYSPPSAPGLDDPKAEAQPWVPTFGDWFSNLLGGDNDTIPVAPDVTADVLFECEAELNIRDLSDNENGFRVYRQLGNSADWELIDTLQAWSGAEWISYVDPGVFGSVVYYVSAFNEAGEASSGPTYAVAPGDCHPPDPVISSAIAVQFQSINMLNTATPDMLYCYRSINGGIWSRWPSSDFFYPNQDGSFDLNEVMEIVQMEIDAWLEESYSLDLECWGWYGAGLQYLGVIHYGGGSPATGDLSVIGDALQANLAIKPINDLGPFYQLGGDLDPEFALDLGGDFFKFLIDQQMQFPMVQVTYNPDLCESHLPPEFQNLFGRILFCFPYPGFQGNDPVGNDEVQNPQPYLIWDFWNQCRDGYGIEPDGACRSYQSYLEQAELNNGRLGFIIYDWSSAGFHQWIVEAPQFFEMTIPPNGCNGERTFSVVMFYEEDGFTQYSPKGNDWSIECPKPVSSVLTVDFVFDNVTFSNLDDGDSGEQTVEVFGYFQVSAPSSPLGANNFLKMGAWDEQWSECPDDTGGFSSNTPSCPQVFTNGSFNLANVPLCKSSDYTQADEFHCWQTIGNTTIQDFYQTNNNRARVQITDGDGILMVANLIDWDDASANDSVCVGLYEIPAGMTVFEWDAMDGTSFSLYGMLGETGDCIVSGTIDVVE